MNPYRLRRLKIHPYTYDRLLSGRWELRPGQIKAPIARTHYSDGAMIEWRAYPNDLRVTFYWDCYEETRIVKVDETVEFHFGGTTYKARIERGAGLGLNGGK